jgi:hypothetical protein
MESEGTLDSLDYVSDDELLRRLSELVSHSRRVEADLVAHIGEVEERRLYAREASPSMFAYWYDQTKADALSGNQAHRGRSQKPRSLDGSQEGN